MRELLELLVLVSCLILQTSSFGTNHLTIGSLQSSVVNLSSTLANVDSSTVVNSDNEHNTQVGVVPPNGSFRNTQLGEVSIASFNMLAPFYNSLAIDDWKKREIFLSKDRAERVPLSIQMAKQTNADILCLQEVEGMDQEEQFRKWLKEPIQANGETISGYDSLLWTSLLPNRPGDVVGLCVAWRSDKHKLLASDCFKRGMIVQMAEVETGATIALANVHLPAKPSNILGRLKTMSRTITKLACYDAPKRHSPLDGLLVVCGDFNCDADSVASRLLTTGRSPYGNLRDRNYKANVSKASAAQMRHGYQFQDVYEHCRNEIAPVTVSLHGRGPGCMDQLFFAQFDKAPKNQQQRLASNKDLIKITKAKKGKRKSRRQKAIQVRSRERRSSSRRQNSIVTRVKVDTLLATVMENDERRLELINRGLPNLEAGFPSDHIPIGAMFVPNPDYQERKSICVEQALDSVNGSSEPQANSVVPREIGGVTTPVRRRREHAAQSISVRRRHNAVLRCVADWLEQLGASDMVRDQPLYKNPIVQGVDGLKKKSRAPDLICRLGSALVVVEVTVSTKPDEVRKQKLQKYSDLGSLLPTSPIVSEAGWKVSEDPFVIVLDTDGRIPDDTKQDILNLAALSMSTSIDDETAQNTAKQFCNYMQAMFSEAQELIGK